MMGKFQDFLGQWVVAPRPHPNTSGTSKDGYYPAPEVVRVEFYKTQASGQSPTSPQTRDVVKIRVLEGQWDGREPLEKAHFFYMGGRLVSNPVNTSVLNEAGDDTLQFAMYVELTSKTSMKSYLGWSDGDFGCWGCVGG